MLLLSRLCGAKWCTTEQAIGIPQSSVQARFRADVACALSVDVSANSISATDSSYPIAFIFDPNMLAIHHGPFQTDGRDTDLHCL